MSSLSPFALTLALALGAGACKGKADNANNTNTTVSNVNANTPVMTSTPTTAAEDVTIKGKVEDNLTKYGITGVTVEVKEGVVTLRGDVPSAKFMDAVKAGNEAGARRVVNELVKK
ncbi:MAG TPA: BON domain-containing protein [Pyrinomonadaceae bacterium]|nr:BON domain-containing protein [Pyrinomonadaceae bacterium]